MQNLIDANKAPAQLMQLKCASCGFVGEPKKWEHRNIVGIFLIASPLLMLIYFVFTNPYMCSKCKQRNYLTKILNNGKEIPIKCLPNKTFITVFITLLVASIVYTVISLSGK